VVVVAEGVVVVVAEGVVVVVAEGVVVVVGANVVVVAIGPIFAFSATVVMSVDFDVGSGIFAPVGTNARVIISSFVRWIEVMFFVTRTGLAVGDDQVSATKDPVPCRGPEQVAPFVSASLPGAVIEVFES
jgi:hypothetical protein